MSAAACLPQPGAVNISTGSPQAPIADVDVAAVAALIGDRARCAMLHCLLDSSERPAGELARAAGVSATTASGHLHRLVGAGLLTVRACGRHRYYALVDWTERRPHLAGALPAALLTRFLELGWLARRHIDRGLRITDLGRAQLAQLARPSSVDTARYGLARRGLRGARDF